MSQSRTACTTDSQIKISTHTHSVQLNSVLVYPQACDAVCKAQQEERGVFCSVLHAKMRRPNPRFAATRAGEGSPALAVAVAPLGPRRTVETQHATSNKYFMTARHEEEGGGGGGGGGSHPLRDPS